MEALGHMISFAMSHATRDRSAVYLDTNIWSALAKGEVPIEPLAAYIKQERLFLSLERMQLAELSARPDIMRGVAEVLGRTWAVMLDRGEREFSGERWYQVPVEYQLHLALNTQELKDAFVSECSTIDRARRALMEDANRFETWLQEALRNFPVGTPRDWSIFPDRLKARIRALCWANGHAADESTLDDPLRYIGLRLSYGVLFSRYVINGQAWRRSDYVDYLHAADMAYARVVVTEKNLGECLRQTLRRPEVSGPELVVDISWLRGLG